MHVGKKTSNRTKGTYIAQRKPLSHFVLQASWTTTVASCPVSLSRDNNKHMQCGITFLKKHNAHSTLLFYITIYFRHHTLSIHIDLPCSFQKLHNIPLCGCTIMYITSSLLMDI